VIGLAAFGNRSTLAAALAAGIESLVFKPVDADLLASELRHGCLAKIIAPGLGLEAGHGQGPRAA
jgi:hypothetical protein